jgi:hypothetical protein
VRYCPVVIGALAFGDWAGCLRRIDAKSPKALAALTDAEKAGWRGPGWRYHRDVDPRIRNEREFKAICADVERDMARQRAALAAKPKDAPLDLQATGT